MERIAGLMAALCLLTACSGGADPLRPSTLATLNGSATTGGVTGVGNTNREILVLDRCEPDSFNAAIGPGTCINHNGGITFDAFLALLQQQQRVPSWRFSADTIHVPADLTLPIVNLGGETHTFTEVEEFGGGIVPLLNTLSGTPVPAPECLALGPSDFIPAGARTTHAFETGKAEKYQCCIHPWMRAVTR